jgi:tRNA threonylcarbamoyl adenosine modification protein YeaZ
MLLALDTATQTASVALYDLTGDLLLAELTWQARRRHTQDTLAAAQTVLRMAGVGPTALTSLAVTTGPGSFTGVRIGISAVKGIGLGLPQPPRVVGLPTLSVTAAPWLEAAATTSPSVTVCACIQAGRGRYNWVLFASGDLLRRPSAAEHHAGTAAEFAAALAALAPQPLWLAGEIDTALRTALSAPEFAAPGALAHLRVLDAVSGLRRAGHLARLAALHLAAGIAGANHNGDDLARLQPLYLHGP